MSLIVQPLASAPADACVTSSVAASRFASSTPIFFGSAHVSSLAPMPIAFVPVASLPTATLESQRGAISEILVALGSDEVRAREMSTQLTAEDLAVLLANPRMMQKAGDAVLIIGALLVVGVIVALVLMADSSTVVVSL